MPFLTETELQNLHQRLYDWQEGQEQLRLQTVRIRNELTLYPEQEVDTQELARLAAIKITLANTLIRHLKLFYPNIIETSGVLKEDLENYDNALDPRLNTIEEAK